MRHILWLFPLLTACDARMAEDTTDWWGAMGPLDQDVEEPLEFVQAEYDLQGAGVQAIRNAVSTGTRVYSPEASPPGSCGWSTSSSLPVETWAMVTAHPRIYYKTQGCDRGSDEKYYGSYFIEDQTGGMFVLNDSKVAHFDMGDRIKIRVHGVAEAFGLPRVMTHEIVEVDRGPHPIKYTWLGSTSFTGDDQYEYDDPEALGRVGRVIGEVMTSPDTFGQFQIEDDEGNIHTIGLDSELNRRKVRPPLGARIQVTGPVLNSFGHKVVVMRVGQIEVLE